MVFIRAVLSPITELSSTGHWRLPDKEAQQTQKCPMPRQAVRQRGKRNGFHFLITATDMSDLLTIIGAFLIVFFALLLTYVH